MEFTRALERIMMRPYEISMKFDPNKHHRRSNRIKGYDYAAPGGYYVTILSVGRAFLFGEVVDHQMRLSPKGQIADECWRAIPGHFPIVELGAYVIMPNHVHGIIILQEHADADAFRSAISSPTVGAQHAAPLRVQPGSLGSIIRQYKSSVTRKIVGQYGGVPDIWQRNYYEHIIRDDEDHKRIHLYIESNPVNWMSDDENPDICQGFEDVN